MKRKPDVLVLLAALLGVGIAVSSVGNTKEIGNSVAQPQLAQSTQIIDQRQK